MASIPTMRIENPSVDGEFLTINACDFDPAKHTEFIAKSRLHAIQKEETKAPKRETLSMLPAIEVRLTELQELAQDWRQIKSVAESAGITEKPADGWDAAVLPILVAEYGQAAAEKAYTNPEVAADE
jgi:hypothetical protein